MHSPRPTIILILVIFHFVGASCCLAGGMIQSTGFLERTLEKFLENDPKELQNLRETQRIVREEVWGYETFKIVDVCASFLLSAMLVGCGWGLLQMKSWARWGSIAFAVIAILYTLVATVYSVVCVIPVTDEINAKMVKTLQESDPDKAQSLEMVNQMGNVLQIGGGACLTLIYPLVVLAIMFSPPVRSAFHPADPKPHPPSDEGKVPEENQNP